MTCEYCLGQFVPSRRDAITCSAACRQARRRALRADEIWPASLDDRRESYSRERLHATGYGLVTVGEAYQADLRVRRNVYVLAVVATLLRAWWG